MDFDQMMDAWRIQEEKPLYGVNGDLLGLVLQHEQDKIRRKLRRDQWITYIAAPGMALFTAFWLWVAVRRGAPVLSIVVAGAGTAIFALWVGTFWMSRRRQARRERGFGNSLKDEIGRNLSLVEYQISNGRWSAALLWTAPVMIGAALLYWLIFQINSGPGFSVLTHFWFGLGALWSVLLIAYAGDRNVKRKLEPRRERLRELLKSLEAS